MKTRTAAATAMANKPHSEPIHFIVIEFTAPQPLTLRVSDRYLPKSGGFDECLPLVQAWGTIDEPLQATDAGGSPATFDGLALFNDVPVAGRDRLSDLMYSPDNPTGYEFAFAKVSVYRMDADLGAGTEELLGVFYLEDPTEIGEHLLRLRASDITQVIENQLGLVTITRALFPFAHPDAIDQTIPIAIGRLDQVPALSILSSQATTLTADVAIGATLLAVTDASLFPAPPFYIQVDAEIVRVSASAATLMTLDNETSAPHAIGGAVRELRLTTLVTDLTTQAMGIGATQVPVANSAIYPSTPFTIVVEDETRTASILSATRLLVTVPFGVAHGSGSIIIDILRSQVSAYRYVLCENRGPYLTRGNVIVYNRGVRLSSGYTITPDDRSLIQGKSFVTISLDGLPSVTVPGSADAISVNQSAASSVVRLGTNTPVSVSRVGAGSVSGTITVPSAPPGVLQTCVRTVLIVVTAWGGGGPSWIFERQGGQDIWVGGAGTTPGSGTFLYDPGGPTYEDEVVTLIVGAGGTGTFSFDLVYLRLDVETLGTLIVPGRPESITEEEAQISASVEGVQDDDLGSITGTPRTLLERPADIAAFLLTCYPGTSLADRGSHWGLTRDRQAGLHLVFLLGADGPERFSDLRRLIGMQGRCRLFTEAGKIDLRYIEDAPAIDLTLDYRRDVWEQVPAVAEKTSRTQVFNRVVISAQRDYAGGSGFRYSQTFEDLTQPGLRDPIETSLELPWVQDAGVADRLGAFWLGRWKRPRFQINAVGWQNLLALEKGDHLAVTNHPVLAAHGGAARPFAIYRKSYQLSSDNPARIQITAIEAAA